MGMILFSFILSTTLFAQEAEEAPKPTLMVVSTVHWSSDYAEGTPERWLEIEKEYHEKVTLKNEYVLNTNFLLHTFTADNSEAKAVALYASWADIEKAGERDGELIKEGWPDEAARDAFFKERGMYYSSMHSDEIYSVLDGGKALTARPEKGLLYYVRVSHLAFPADAKDGEMKELHTAYNENVTFKNEYVKAYYLYRHFYGADSRELTEVFAMENLADLEAMLKKNGELRDAAWSEEEQKEFGEKYSKYWTGFHADYVYTGVLELMK